MKKIGITIDNWKQPGFESELKKRGFSDYKIADLSGLAKGTKLIEIFVTEEEFEAKKEEIRRMCVKLEITLKRTN